MLRRSGSPGVVAITSWYFESMNSSGSDRRCLHLVARSSTEALELCLAHFVEGDTLLLIDDGVMLLAGEPGARFESLLMNAVYLREDLDARGLAGLAEQSGARKANDSDFLELLQRHDLCVTWK